MEGGVVELADRKDMERGEGGREVSNWSHMSWSLPFGRQGRRPGCEERQSAGWKI